MGYLINLLLGIFGSLIAAEIVLHHERWCRRLIRAAALRIEDPVQSEIKLEEWLAALDEHVGVVASFSHANGCWSGARAVANALKQPLAEKVRDSRNGNSRSSLDENYTKIAIGLVELRRRLERLERRLSKEHIKMIDLLNVFIEAQANYLWGLSRARWWVFCGICGSFFGSVVLHFIR